MATLAEFNKAQETVRTFRKEAIDSVSAYINSGLSNLGNSVTVGRYMDNHEYFIDFSVEIKADKNNKVLVWLTPWASQDPEDVLTVKVPVEVLG